MLPELILCQGTRRHIATHGSIVSEGEFGSAIYDLFKHSDLEKAIINFAKARGAAKQNGIEPPSIGRGIAMAVGLFFIVILTSICQHQVIHVLLFKLLSPDILLARSSFGVP